MNEEEPTAKKHDGRKQNDATRSALTENHIQHKNSINAARQALNSSLVWRHLQFSNASILYYLRTDYSFRMLLMIPAILSTMPFTVLRCGVSTPGSTPFKSLAVICCSLSLCSTTGSALPTCTTSSACSTTGWAAGGIEDAEDDRLSSHFDINLRQGYYYGKPQLLRLPGDPVNFEYPTMN